MQERTPGRRPAEVITIQLVEALRRARQANQMRERVLEYAEDGVDLLIDPRGEYLPLALGLYKDGSPNLVEAEGADGLGRTTTWTFFREDVRELTEIKQTSEPTGLLRKLLRRKPRQPEPLLLDARMTTALHQRVMRLVPSQTPAPTLPSSAA